MPPPYRRLFTRGEYRWPGGMDRSVAGLALTPEEFTARTEVPFTSGLDDLDYFRAVGIELSSGTHVVLLWYERSPAPLLHVQADIGADLAVVRDEFLAAFGLGEADISWVPSDTMEAG